MISITLIRIFTRVMKCRNVTHHFLTADLTFLASYPDDCICDLLFIVLSCRVLASSIAI